MQGAARLCRTWQGQGVGVSSDAPGCAAADTLGVVGFSLGPLTNPFVARLFAELLGSTPQELRVGVGSGQVREGTSPGPTRPPEPGRYWLVNVPRRSWSLTLHCS